MDDAERSDHGKSLLKEASHLDHAEIEVSEMNERFFDGLSEGSYVPGSFQLIVQTILKHGTLASRQLFHPQKLSAYYGLNQKGI
jgi:hypothetical protein